MHQPAPVRPPGRYGERSRSRRLRLTAVVVMVATAMVGWLVWAGLTAANPDVRSQVLDFTIRSDGVVRIHIGIIADKHRTVTCTVRGQDRSLETVGIAQMVSGPGRRVRDARADITTRDRAVTATIVGCRADGGR